MISAWKRSDQPARECDCDQAAKLRFRTPRNPKVESSHIVAGVQDHDAPSGSKPDNMLVTGLALCSSPGVALLNVGASEGKSRETPCSASAWRVLRAMSFA